VVLDLELSKQATATPFHRTDFDCDEFHILAHTKPLFRNLPNPGNLTVRAMSLAELKSSSKCYTKILTYLFNHQILESTTLPRPAHMQPKKIDDITSETNDLTFNIRSLADPEDIYSTTLGAADVSHSHVHIPDVRNKNGDLVSPDQYDKKLEDGSIVMVDVYLKMYVLFFLTVTVFELNLFSQVEHPKTLFIES
jgi:hypothetical protein